MKFKGTQGKWRVNKDEGLQYNEYNIGYLTIDFNDYQRNCVDVYTGGDEDIKETEANAQLIASAPELLEFAIEMVKRYPNSPWITEQGQKAINKALGYEN
jgi:hypothetical protein